MRFGKGNDVSSNPLQCNRRSGGLQVSATNPGFGWTQKGTRKILLAVALVLMCAQPSAFSRR
jgi:hypothetical protein